MAPSNIDLDMHTASPLSSFSTFESTSTATSTSASASTPSSSSASASVSATTSKDKEQAQKHIQQSQDSREQALDETTVPAHQQQAMTQSTSPSSTATDAEKSKRLPDQSNGADAHRSHHQHPRDNREKGPNEEQKAANGGNTSNGHDLSAQDPRGDQDGDVHMNGQSQDSPRLSPSLLPPPPPPQTSRSTAKSSLASPAKPKGRSQHSNQGNHVSPRSNRPAMNNRGLESGDENDGEQEDLDMDVDAPQPSDEKYKRLKRKLKEVLEENDRMSQELDKTYRRVRNLRKEKNLLLDRLCLLERRSLDSGSDSLSSLSSDSDSSDSSLDIVQTRRTSPVRATSTKVARSTATGGAQQAARSATSSSAPATSQTHHPKKTTAKGSGQTKGSGNGGGGTTRESRPTTTSTPSTITNVGSATQKPKRLHNPNKLRPSLLKVRKVQALEKDENGRVKLPVTIGILTILDTGYVVYDREAFHNERYIWPVGYRMKRLYNSMINPSEQTTYTCSVIDDGEAPKFQIDAEDQPGKPIIAGTATGAWTHVVKAANLIRKRDHSNSASGPDYYGFSNATIAKMIQDLPNADKCPSYIMQRFEEPSSASIERRKAVMAMASNSSKATGAGSASTAASGSAAGSGTTDSGAGTGATDGSGAADEEGVDEDEEGAEDDRDEDGNDDDENEDNDEGEEEEEGEDEDEMYTSLGSVGDKQHQAPEESIKIRRAGFEPPFTNAVSNTSTEHSTSHHEAEGARPSGTVGVTDEPDMDDDDDDGADGDSQDEQGDDDELTDSDSETVERRRMTTSGAETATELGSSSSPSSAPLATLSASGSDAAVSAGNAVHSIATLGENRSPIVVTTTGISGASGSLAGQGTEAKGNSDENNNGNSSSSNGSSSNRTESKADPEGQDMDVDVDVEAGEPMSS